MPWYVYANYDLSPWKCQNCNALQECNSRCTFCHIERKKYYKCENAIGQGHIHLRDVSCSFDPKSRSQFRCYEFTTFEKQLQELLNDNKHLAYFCNACKSITTSNSPEIDHETQSFHFWQKLFYYSNENDIQSSSSSSSSFFVSDKEIKKIQNKIFCVSCEKRLVVNHELLLCSYCNIHQTRPRGLCMQCKCRPVFGELDEQYHLCSTCFSFNTLDSKSIPEQELQQHQQNKCIQCQLREIQEWNFLLCGWCFQQTDTERTKKKFPKF